MTPSRLSISVALSAMLLAGAGCAVPGRQSGATPVSHMVPHPIPDSGVFFEGWYLRLTAPEALSVGALVASWHDKTLDRSESYRALFVQMPGATRLDVHDAVSSARPSISTGGASGGATPQALAPATFRWELNKDNVVTERSMAIALPDGARFSATLGEPVFWNPANPFEGPEGDWLDSSWLKSHWFVYSTASTANWTLTSADGSERSGVGLAHFEKNWGASFPRRWVWAQGVDPRTGTSFVLAGGDNPLVPRMPGGAWMIGVRSPLGAWSYATARTGQEVIAWPDGCRGSVSIRADSPEGVVDISIAAPRDSFGSLEAPQAGGFEPLSEMSFRGEAVLRLTTRRDGEDVGTSTFTLPASALEFGGAWRCDAEEKAAAGPLSRATDRGNSRSFNRFMPPPVWLYQKIRAVVLCCIVGCFRANRLLEYSGCCHCEERSDAAI